MTTILQLDDLSFAYAGQAPIAKHWSAAIPAGVTLLTGDTGSGKTTLLQVLAGVLPAAGRLTLAGARLGEEPTTYESRRFWCDPTTDAYDQLTARACTALLSAGDAGFDSVAWEALVTGFALPPHLGKPMYMLSSGSRRKVYLAAALASGRPLILLDEPTGALDGGSIRHLTRRLAQLAAQRERAVVVASCERSTEVDYAHVIELPADPLADA